MSLNLTPHQRKKKLAPVLLILTVVVGIAGVIASLFVYYTYQNTSHRSLMRRASTMVQLLPTELISDLTATEQDLESASYVRLKDLLTRAREANSDLRFVYLMGIRPDGEMFFFVDSEDPSSEDYSHPGQVYEEPSDILRDVFENGVASIDVADDEYGFWLSGLVPIISPDGRTVAVLGIDTPAQPYFFQAIANSVIPFLVALVLMVILLSIRRNLQREIRFIEEKEEFLSLAAHEIRTPVTGISWAIEGMIRAKENAFAPAITKTLNLMLDTSNNLLQRINNLLSVTKIEAAKKGLKKENVHIRQMIEEIGQSMTFAAQKRGITIAVDESMSPSLLILCDREQVHHVAFNLISNAIKYAHEGTAVRISYEKEATQHAVSVTNHGDRMTDEEMTHIFDGYHRTERSIRSGQDGTGLGLYLVKKVMELHGGSIGVTSKDDTTFTVRFPFK